MVERCVTDLGGMWVFCDTDSMAIVATPHGGLVPCPGGPERLPDGREGVRALSFAQVDGIQPDWIKEIWRIIIRRVHDDEAI